jgi:hypothetical protein
MDSILRPEGIYAIARIDCAKVIATAPQASVTASRRRGLMLETPYSNLLLSFHPDLTNKQSLLEAYFSRPSYDLEECLAFGSRLAGKISL